MWSNTHDARDGCRQPDYIVIIMQTEIILTSCCMSAPAANHGSYPRSTPALQLLFNCRKQKRELAFGQSLCCSQIKWALQEVSSSLGLKGLGLLLHLWAPVAPSQGICLQVVKRWFTLWDDPSSAVRFALLQYWCVSFNRVLVAGWGGRLPPACFCLSKYSVHLSVMAIKIIYTFPSPFVFSVYIFFVSLTSKLNLFLLYY